MLKFIGSRLLAVVAVVVGLSFATFMIVRLVPGDPAVAAAGDLASPQQIALTRKALGLDEPIPQQFSKYLTDLLKGDLGTSFVTREATANLIVRRIGPTLQLASLALLFMLVVAIPTGIVAAELTRENRHPRAEVGYVAVASVIGSLPEYLAATFLAFVFAVWLRLVPIAGTEGWQSLILPTLAVSMRPSAMLSRMVRVETLNVLAQDYIRTARSKRLPQRLVYMRHVLPNVVTAALTVGGLLFASLIGGAVIVENVFARSGLGTALVAAVLARDYPVIQGTTMVLGVVVVLVNAVVDVMLVIVNPRSLARQA